MNKNNYEPGTIFLCKVTSIAKNYFEVLTSNKEQGLVYINETSDYFIKDLNGIINIGDIFYLTLKKIRNDGVLLLSFKENRSCFLKMPFEFKINKSHDDSYKFQNVFDFTNKEIKKWKK